MALHRVLILIVLQGDDDRDKPFSQRFWGWVAAELANDALGFIACTLGIFAITFGGMYWIIVREITFRYAAFELRMKKEREGRLRAWSI